MMKDHCIQMVGGKKEEDFIKWGNEKVDEKYRVKDLKDKSLKNSLFYLNILKSIEPQIINQEYIKEDSEDDESLMNNAKYCLSVIRKMGGTVFLVWEDLKEVKSKLLLTLMASIYNVAMNYKKK